MYVLIAFENKWGKKILHSSQTEEPYDRTHQIYFAWEEKTNDYGRIRLIPHQRQLNVCQHSLISFDASNNKNSFLSHKKYCNVYISYITYVHEKTIYDYCYTSSIQLGRVSQSYIILIVSVFNAGASFIT